MVAVTRPVGYPPRSGNGSRSRGYGETSASQEAHRLNWPSFGDQRGPSSTPPGRVTGCDRHHQDQPRCGHFESRGWVDGDALWFYDASAARPKRTEFSNPDLSANPQGESMTVWLSRPTASETGCRSRCSPSTILDRDAHGGRSRIGDSARPSKPDLASLPGTAQRRLTPCRGTGASVPGSAYPTCIGIG